MRLSIREFVEDKHGRTRVCYCKNPRGCEGVIFVPDDATATALCCGVCGFSFCALCDMMAHAPATCEMIKEW